MAENKNRVQLVKYAPPPPELPIYGRVRSEEVSFFGRSNYVAALEEKRFIFGIKRGDRRRHLYIIGKSGVGKTKLQELLIRQDIAYGHGLCLIDPDGELFDSIIDFIPKDRIDDVCIIDPRESGCSFNPFFDVDHTVWHQSAQNFLESFKKNFGSSWNPHQEHLLRFAVLALLECPESNLSGISKLLTDKEFRISISERVQDEMVRRFWREEFDEWAEKFDNSAIIPILNKFSQFFSDPSLKRVFSSQTNKINFADLIQNRKIILANLSSGELGTENSGFFGSLIIGKIKEAGMARARSNESHDDFYIYIDEFPNLVNETFDNILSESRKYNFCITVAHQYLGQLDSKTISSILGNIGNIIAFRVGGDDALKMKPEFAPTFDVKDMINLGVGEFYMKIVIDGATYEPFSAELLKVLPPNYESSREEIYKSSELKFGNTEN